MDPEDVVEINLEGDITTEFIFRARLHDDEAAIILKGHLLIEYLIDRVIDKKLKSPKKILDDSRSYTFSVKVQILYAVGLIPEYAYQNIVKINKFRNQLAHDLNVQIKPENMIIVSTTGEQKVIRPKRQRYPQRRYLRLLCHATLLHLKYHLQTVLGVDAGYHGISHAW